MMAQTYMADKPALQKLFNEFEQEDLDCIELVYYAQNLTIIHKDSSAEYIYIIVKGICGTFKELVNGEEFCTYKISTLDVIGMSEILGDHDVRRYATVRTLTDVIAFRMRKANLREWMQKYPRFYNELVIGVINRLHSKLSKHVECKMYNAHANIVSYLSYSYELYVNSYDEGYQNLVKINETREMISDFLGTSVRTINSTVEKLKNLDLIHVKNGKIHMTRVQYERMIEYKYELLMI